MIRRKTDGSADVTEDLLLTAVRVLLWNRFDAAAIFVSGTGSHLSLQNVERSLVSRYPGASRDIISRPPHVLSAVCLPHYDLSPRVLSCPSAIYNYDPSGEQELRLQVGDTVHILEKLEGE